MHDSPTLPRFVALCGHPTSGKTTAAELLNELYGYRLADDGQFLREIGKEHFGLSHHQVYTQAGKLEKVTINGEEMTVRDVLGRIGNGFEQQFGANVIPELAHKSLPAEGRFVFGSVRREQGAYHRGRGALIIELKNPLVGPSPYEFDRFNTKHCHIAIDNDGLARGLSGDDARADLKTKLKAVVDNASSIVRGMAV